MSLNTTFLLIAQYNGKDPFGLFVRTVGIMRAEAKIIMANLVHNFDWLIFHERRNATGSIRSKTRQRR